MADQDFEYGYDPTVPEPMALTPRPAAPPTLPTSANVDQTYLPPVGHQSTPNCAAWASTYGLATFMAASAAGQAPSSTSQQASPAYIYIQVMQGNGVGNDTCQGSQLMSYFKILSGGGTSSMAGAPYYPSCDELWTTYGSSSPPIDSAFGISLSNVNCIDTHDVSTIQGVIASGYPVAYGTSLYTDFPHYKGCPVPYVGSGTILMNKKTGKPVGHCMVIIAYDNSKGENGAFQLQNSFGTGWGQDGFVWIAYESFVKLAQGKGFYLS